MTISTIKKYKDNSYKLLKCENIELLCEKKTKTIDISIRGHNTYLKLEDVEKIIEILISMKKNIT